jgi:hypothetical protein
MSSVSVFGQDIPDDPAVALDSYIKMREGYKRSNTKQFSKMEQLEMDDYCFAMQEKHPDAYQTDFMWYLNGHFYQDRSLKIKSAYSKAPSDKRVVKAMFGFYVLSNNSQSKVLASKAAKYYSANTLSYYEDALPKSGVLVVSSEEDALPIYILQKVKGKGSGITVVNMDYLINDDYRGRMSGKLGVGSMAFFGSETSFIKKAMQKSDVHVSTTVSQKYISETAFLTGLYYQGTVTSQKKTLEAFWLKISNKNFSSMSLTSSEKRLYKNYLPPLLTLYKLKKNAGVTDSKLRSAIKVIAEKVEQTKTVNNILTDYDKG